MLRPPFLEILNSPEFDLTVEYTAWREELGFDRGREAFWERWAELEVICERRDRCAAVGSFIERQLTAWTIRAGWSQAPLWRPPP